MSGPPSTRPTSPATTATTPTMATNSAGFIEMSATARALPRSARLPCRSRASSIADTVRVPMSDTLRGLSMPRRPCCTRSRGNSSTRAGTGRRRGRRPRRQPESTTSTPPGGDDSGGSGRAVGSGGAVAVGGAVAGGRRGRRRRTVRAARSSARSLRRAGRRPGRTRPTPPAASSADVTGPRAVRLARSVSAVVRLIVSTLMPCDRGDRPRPTWRCCPRPCRRTG